ncbi:MAG TPA: O-antigen ligase family protein [Gemmatimonadales bacterium]|nr:O-antigen ligase family protein [Gemmatimonadales bacterium]
MNGERPLNPVVRWTFYLLVFSIPFEFPDRSFPIEIPTITASLFLFATLLEPRACYAKKPAALLCFVTYLYMYWVSAAINGRDHLATSLITPDYWSQVLKQFLQIVQGVLVLWTGHNLLRSRPLARSTMAVFALACIGRALLPILGIARTARTEWGGGERVTALGQNANNSAMILGAGFIALFALLYGGDRPLLRHRWLAWPGFGLIGLSVIDSGSRGGIVALGLGLGVFALGSARTPWARIRNAAITAFAIVGLVAFTYSNDLMRSRFADALEHGAMAGRERIYPALIEMSEERPLFGWGPVNNKYELGIRLDERIRRRRDAHNLVLEVLTANGLFGAVPFLLGIGLCGYAAWQARRRAHGSLALALFAGVMLANMSGNWIASKLLWLVLAYALASATYAYAAVPARGPARRPPPPPRPYPLPGPFVDAPSRPAIVSGAKL